MALGDTGATDLFSLGTGFNAQTSESSVTNKIVDVLDAAGDIACQTEFETTENATANYDVCGTPTLAISIGQVVGDLIVTAVEITKTAGDKATVSVSGVAYDGNETVTARVHAISIEVNNTVASVLTTPATGLEPNKATVRYELQLTTGMGSNGQVKFATPRTLKVTYSEEGLGTLAAAPTRTGWTLESYNNSDSNQELDTYACSFTQGIALT